MKDSTVVQSEVSDLTTSKNPDKNIRLAMGLLGLVLLVPVGMFTLQARVDLFAQPPNMEQVLGAVSRATFEIKCGPIWTGAGWGLELEGDYYLVTAQHVIDDCQNAEPIAARSQTMPIFSLELVASNGDYWSNDFGTSDLALLKSSITLPTLKFQTQMAKAGQWVIAAGFPLEQDSGPLLILNDGRITGFDLNDHIVTDAAINGGMSGGPLINARGEVVGTVYAADPVSEYENIGYAQPLFEHCGLVVECWDGVANYKLVG